MAKRKPPWATTNKFNVAPKDERFYDGATYPNTTYDSKAEMAYAVGLDLQLGNGLITGWIRQVTIPLGEDNKTRIDFMVFSSVFAIPSGGASTLVNFIEIKGHETPKFKEVRRLWQKYGPGPLLIKKRKGRGWTTELLPGKPKP